MSNRSIAAPIDITLETALLKTMALKSNFDSYIGSVDTNRLLPTTRLLLADYKKYFQMFMEHESIDFGYFHIQFTQNWHRTDLDQMDIDYYRDYVFPAIIACTSDDIEYCLLGLINKNTTEELIRIAS